LKSPGKGINIRGKPFGVVPLEGEAVDCDKAREEVALNLFIRMQKKIKRQERIFIEG
jgi:hypothetical protein